MARACVPGLFRNQTGEMHGLIDAVLREIKHVQLIDSEVTIRYVSCINFLTTGSVQRGCGTFAFI